MHCCPSSRLEADGVLVFYCCDEELHRAELIDLIGVGARANMNTIQIYGVRGKQFLVSKAT